MHHMVEMTTLFALGQITLFLFLTLSRFMFYICISFHYDD